MVAASRSRRRRSVLLVIILTALTLITLDARGGRTGPLGFLGRGAHTLLSPIQGAVDDVANPVGDWWQGVTNSGDIKEENRKLRDQLAAAQGDARANAKDAAENASLREQLGLTEDLDKKGAKYVTAFIRGGEVGNFDPTFTIDKGMRNGIAVHMPVISPAGLVGEVIEVWSNGAKVRTLTDPKFGVAVVTPAHPGSRGATGPATGNGSRTMDATFEAGTKLVKGDDIYTSALSTAFPANIPVGKIDKVADRPGNTSVGATIEPFVNLDELTYLTVVLWVPGQGLVMDLPTTTTTSTTSTTLPFGGFGVTTTTLPFGGFGVTTTTPIGTVP